MRKLKAVSSGFKTFKLFDEVGQLIGKLEYPHWYSYNVDITTNTGCSNIVLEGFWKNKMIQKKHDAEIRSFKNTWRGFLIYEKSGEQLFLNTEGFWDFRYILHDENNNELMMFRPNFEWKKFRSTYDIEFPENYSPDLEFILAVLHCVNYQQHMTAAATN